MDDVAKIRDWLPQLDENSHFYLAFSLEDAIEKLSKKPDKIASTLVIFDADKDADFAPNSRKKLLAKGMTSIPGFAALVSEDSPPRPSTLDQPLHGLDYVLKKPLSETDLVAAFLQFVATR